MEAEQSLPLLLKRLRRVPAGRRLTAIARRNRVNLRAYDPSSSGESQTLATLHLAQALLNQIPSFTDDDMRGIPRSLVGEKLSSDTQEAVEQSREELEHMRAYRKNLIGIETKAMAAQKIINYYGELQRTHIEGKAEADRADFLIVIEKGLRDLQAKEEAPPPAPAPEPSPAEGSLKRLFKALLGARQP